MKIVCQNHPALSGFDTTCTVEGVLPSVSFAPLLCFVVLVFVVLTIHVALTHRGFLFRQRLDVHEHIPLL